MMVVSTGHNRAFEAAYRAKLYVHRTPGCMFRNRGGSWPYVLPRRIPRHICNLKPCLTGDQFYVGERIDDDDNEHVNNSLLTLCTYFNLMHLSSTHALIGQWHMQLLKKTSQSACCMYSSRLSYIPAEMYDM